MMVNDEFRRFVDRHRNEDVAKLRLKYHCCGQAWVEAAINHIECLKKCGRKFGAFQPELMTSPLSVEQATSESVARLHAAIAKETVANPKRILDMTCGMGIDLRAISEALTCKAVGIELSESGAETARYNFRDNPDVAIITGDSVEWLKKYDGDKFDLVFIDPARRGENGERVYNIRDCRPDLMGLLPLLASKCRYAMAKLSPMLDITQTLRDLPQARKLYVAEEGGECRELLALLDFERSDKHVEIVVTDGAAEYRFDPEDERSARETFAHPVVGDFLFEPGAAAMKAAPFGLLCRSNGLKKLHCNTHLFVAASVVGNLPGKWYRIDGVSDMSSRSLKALGKRLGRADVAVRNHPLRPEEMQKRLGIKSGGRHRLIGCTTGDAASRTESGVVLVLSRCE